MPVSQRCILNTNVQVQSGVGSHRTLRLIRIHVIFPSYFINPSLHQISSDQDMPSKPKTSRREHSSEIISIVIALHASGQSYAENQPFETIRT